MAEQKEENERVAYKNTLEEIYEKIKQRLSKNSPENEVVLKGGKSIGILTFKKEQESKTKKLYSISMVVDGKNIDYIYDEDGDNIARVRNNNEVYADDDIQLEQDRLITNMNFSQNDNQGRHIADRAETIIMSDEEKQNSDIANKNQLPNLIDSQVKIGSSAAIIDLYRTIYNGRRLRDMLAIESKLKGRVPAGVDINNLIYLSVVDSASLTAKDGNKRESDITCVIMDDPRNPKYMVELDESILKPRANLSKLENIAADKTSEHLGDGEEKKGTSTTTNTRQIATFEIPEAGANIGQTNDMITLEIRQNSKYIDTSTSQRNDAHNIELYIGIQDKSKSENEQQHGLNTQAIKLESYDETARIEEKEMQDAFRNFFGPDDEFKNRETIQGYDRKLERDENEINAQQRQEKEANDKETEKQYKKEGNVNAEITAEVNERDHYLSMAWNIVHDSNVYGPTDLNYIYKQIMIEKAKMESNKEAIEDEELRKRVEQQIDQKTPGDSKRRVV